MPMATDVDLKRWRFTLDQYHRMGETGILHEDDRVELIEGEIVEMTPIGPRHAWCVALLVQRLTLALGFRAVVWPQNPVDVLPDSEPQPDIVLLRPDSATYGTRHPEPADALLLIEVSDSSLRYDRRVKLPLYARAGVPEVWIVDLEGETIEVYLDPAAGAYRRSAVRRRGERLAPAAFPDVELTVDEILG